ncbi:MAG: UDP-N-acetylglucosamine 2-epimerase (non-hydrolyzing) [Bacillota bacterium]|nr:UDP-N-acetylglucosamine 2-epimerase (non-hydrolyzing) [Bacillota bacterium]
MDPDRPKVLSIFGTRPEAIKMAPLLKQLAQCDKLSSVVCVTGQHREQLDQVLDAFQLQPDFDLNLMKKGQTLAEISSRTFAKVDEVLELVKPNLVLVHGDPSATFCAATVSFYRGIPVGHVEAGLRSGNIESPFPEEFNRVVVDRISKLHFAPTEQNKQLLLAEGFDEATIYVTGNTAIDAINSVVDPDYRFETPLLSELDFSKKVILLTAHRRENLGQRMRQCFRAIRRIADDHPDAVIVYPMHLNKLVRDVAVEVLGDHERIHLIEPLGYFEISNLMARCFMVVTDSGGLQEEAPALGKPVVVMRTETERQEAVDAGTVVIAGVEEEAVYREVDRLLCDREHYDRMASAINPYGDGTASRQIVSAIVSYLERGAVDGSLQ